MGTTQLEECAVSPNRAGPQDRDTAFSSPREEGCWAKADVPSDVRQMLQATREAQLWLRTPERGPKGEATEKEPQHDTGSGVSGRRPLSLGWQAPETPLWTCGPEGQGGFSGCAPRGPAVFSAGIPTGPQHGLKE